MKLGILTVFLVDPNDEPLLDLHLRQVANCTTVPYTIYAAANRLHPDLVEKLQSRPEVRACPCPTTPLRGKEEHSFYLEHLVRAAVEDGATHIVTLHVDSFPIRTGWAEDLIRRLTPSCALVTLNRVNTACLLFHRDFYLGSSPRFLLSDADRASPAFGAFCARWNPIDHSGAGYAFRAFADGFSLCYLHESNANPQATFGVVYEKLVFHLVGAAGIGRSVRTPAGGSRSVQAPWWTVLTQARRFHASLGPSARRLARRLLPASFRRAIGQEVYSEATAQRLFDEAKRNLLRDPRAYWESLAEDRDA